MSLRPKRHARINKGTNMSGAQKVSTALDNGSYDDDLSQVEGRHPHPHLVASTSTGSELTSFGVNRDASNANTGYQSLKLAHDAAFFMNSSNGGSDDDQAQGEELVDKDDLLKAKKLAIQQEPLLAEEKKDDDLLQERFSSESDAMSLEALLKDAENTSSRNENDIHSNDVNSSGTPIVPPQVTPLSDSDDDSSNSSPPSHQEGKPLVTSDAKTGVETHPIVAQRLQKENEVDSWIHEAVTSVGTHSVAPDTATQSSFDDYSQDHTSEEGGPTMVGIGIPQQRMVLSRPPSVYSDLEECKEEIGDLTPLRRKTTEELTQELVDQSLSENFAIDQQNGKDGKKILPDDDPTSLIRRQSSRMSCEKRAPELTYQPSAEFQFQLGGKNASHEFDGNAAYPVPLPSRLPLSSSADVPRFGSRAASDLLADDHVADAGVAFPGAYFVPGIDGNSEITADDFAEIETVVEVGEAVEVGEVGDSRLLVMPASQHIRQAEVATVVHDRVQVEGIPLWEGHTEEERQKAKRQFIKGQLRCATIMMLVTITISIIVVHFRSKRVNSVAKQNAWVLLGDAASGPPLDDGLSFGFALSLSGSGNRFCASVPGMDASQTQSDVGQVQIYNLIESKWHMSATISFDQFEGRAGEALALSSDGTRMIVGSPGWSSDTGLVSVLQEDEENNWIPVGGELSGQPSDLSGRFGDAVDISSEGQVIAVSAPFSVQGGIVRVYEQVVSQWVRMGDAIVAPSTESLFGSSLSLSSDGRRIAIGASNFGVGLGQVTVYDFNGTHWNQVGQTLEGIADFENFGSSVSLQGNLLAVGAPGSAGADGRFNSGKVQVFQLLKDKQWTQYGRDILGKRSESLGHAVALSENGILAVGSPQRPQTRETGVVKVYAFNSKDWMRVENEIEGSLESESFGYAVDISMDGSIVGVGAPNADFDGRLNQVGAVRIFENSKYQQTASSSSALLRGG